MSQYQISADPARIAYMPIGGGYEYAALRVGLMVRNPAGLEVYIQMGDDANAMRANLAALDEISLDADDPKRGIIADMLLSDYFAEA